VLRFKVARANTRQWANNARSRRFGQLSIFPTATLSFGILVIEPMKMELKERMERLRRLRFVDSLIGALLCALAAVGASAVAIGHSWTVSVPLVFIAILLLISSIFGTRAGILGTVLAALIFSAFLYSPLGSFHVDNQTAKGNLAWMLLIGVSFSFLFAPSSGWFRRH
jgi:K+-sensing histidine kinase KdpD